MKKILAVFLCLAILTPAVALAQTSACVSNGSTTAAPNQLGTCVSQIYLWALGAAAMLAVGMMIFGGYQVMTASGNAQRASTGKSYLVSSLVGIALLLGAYLLLQTINPDLTDLKLDTSCFENPALPHCAAPAPSPTP
jgi:hypothetical protein